MGAALYIGYILTLYTTTINCRLRYEHPLLRNITKMERDVHYVRQSFDQTRELLERVLQQQDQLLRSHQSISDALLSLQTTHDRVNQSLTSLQQSRDSDSASLADVQQQLLNVSSWMNYCFSDCLDYRRRGFTISRVIMTPQAGAAAGSLCSQAMYCDMETDGGGWTVVQRHTGDAVSFNRTWDEYSAGFGQLDGDFWWGNEQLHRTLNDAES